MNNYIPGQRWISDAELHLGLGTVVKVEHRTVDLIFLATGEARTYAKQTAPLTRVTFNIGDNVNNKDNESVLIREVREDEGLLTYIGVFKDGSPTELPESQLDNAIQLNRPAERLFSGQIDADRWFELRYNSLQHSNRLAQSELRGLTGSRTSLIPHQLYIAHEVANRYAPRVLLADEVGLGKTIEAGLILHHQLLTERAQRVLIVVPESLTHQWLVEMLRRFNLHFSVFDEQRCQAIEGTDDEDFEADETAEQEPAINPFHTEQLVLCSLEFLSSNPTRFKQAYLGEWDLLVVDEAHHLAWSPEEASLEYELIDLLATETKGVLLLTATPEQLGKASHYARLRLLDPDRFPDYDSFIAEEKSYEPIAQAIECLLSDEIVDESTTELLRSALQGSGIDFNAEALQQADNKNRIVEQLLDRHGTGRVLFRNTRSAVKGFPERQLNSYPLEQPQAYADSLRDFNESNDYTDTRLLLCPELLYQMADPDALVLWTDIDPRVEWLIAQLKTLRPKKVLLITASAMSAMDLAAVLRVKAGINAGLFHEQLSIIERDRAAAYFADEDDGCQLMICSEIGSEGRNFQFAHHLIVFDLPLNPDLLEQRIGRLDRIGQKHTIQIHAPYLEHTAQAVMLHWYHDALNAFEHTCPAGHNVFVEVEESLQATLHNADQGQALDELISHSKKYHQQLNDDLHRGRDRLLEYNSCRPQVANALRDKTAQLDTEANLFDYMETVFDCYGVDSEPHREGSHVIHPGNHMHTSHFPHLREEGMTITCDRNIALSNENMHFLTWEHPMVTGVMEMILGNEQGNTAVTSTKYSGANAGTLLVECIYILESPSSETLQTSRYLPPTAIRVVVDQQGKNHDLDIPHHFINNTREKVDSDTASKIVHAYADIIRSMLAAGEKIAKQQAPKILANAHQHTQMTLEKEINRLKDLRQVNPNVRDEEIDFFSEQWKALNEALASATPRLDALRVIVVT